MRIDKYLIIQGPKGYTIKWNGGEMPFDFESFIKGLLSNKFDKRLELIKLFQESIYNVEKFCYTDKNDKLINLLPRESEIDYDNLFKWHLENFIKAFNALNNSDIRYEEVYKDLEHLDEMTNDMTLQRALIDEDDEKLLASMVGLDRAVGEDYIVLMKPEPAEPQGEIK